MNRNFVYVFRDRKGDIVYVGKGKSSNRPAQHTNSHNERLKKLLAHGKFSVQIAGPFATPEQATILETALISLHFNKGGFNKKEGPSKYRFRPLGVPLGLSKRLDEDISIKDLVSLANKPPVCPILLVYVNSKKLADGRDGVDLSELPTDSEMISRVTQWWQLGNRIESWEKNAHECPKALVGVTGTPNMRVVVASLEIDRKSIGRGSIEAKARGLVNVPIKPGKMDFLGLRGRVISSSPKRQIKFGQFRHQQFILIHPNGKVEGGVM